MFKVGDKVKIARLYEDAWDGVCQGYSERIGETGIVTSIEGEHVRVDGDGCYHFRQLDPIGKQGKRGRPSTKPRPVKFLLKYDLDVDPIEEFETMEQVKERIEYLVQHESSLKRDSILVYEIKSKKSVSVATKLIFK